MYYLVFEATPRPTAADPEIAGAFVSCFIDLADAQEAEREARALIEGQGWFAGKPDEVRACSAADFEGTALLEYFWQATVDGEVLIFHQYPDSEGADD